MKVLSLMCPVCLAFLLEGVDRTDKDTLNNA